MSSPDPIAMGNCHRKIDALMTGLKLADKSYDGKANVEFEPGAKQVMSREEIQTEIDKQYVELNKAAGRAE